MKAAKLKYTNNNNMTDNRNEAADIVDRILLFCHANICFVGWLVGWLVGCLLFITVTVLC